MSCKPESSILLDSLTSKIKDTLLATKLSDGSSILDFLDRIDIQDVLKVSIEISIPEKIKEFQFRSSSSCEVWDEDKQTFITVRPCPD